MLGMNFASFLVLLVIGCAMALLYQYGFRCRFVEGLDSLVGKIALGWIGAWLGSPFSAIGSGGFRAFTLSRPSSASLRRSI
jgi:hypothetical protein